MPVTVTRVAMAATVPLVYRSGMASITRLDHVNLRTDRLDETIAFFEEVLGLENRPEQRPDFGFPGAWLFVGDQAVVHLIEASSTETPAGALDHVAFATPDFDSLLTTLDERDLPHRVSEQPGNGVRQVFFREPNGVLIEVSSTG